jgi:hypothetical protein
MPHDLRRKPKEMRAVLPLDILPIDQPHVSFVAKRRRLEDVAGALGSHVAMGYAMQFRVNQRHEFFQGQTITIVPRQQQLSDLVG